MIPTQEMTAYPTFGDNSSRVKPDDAKYAAGFLPGDVVPAEWFNWLLNRGSSATTKLNAGALAMEQEINSVLAAGEQNPDATKTNQLLLAISHIINQVRRDEQQKPAVGVPTLWMGPKPEWALDFGNGAATQYLWANYPKLNTDKFKSILTALSSAGWMTAHDDTGFYVPDLRGIVPIGYGTNIRRTDETYNGGSVGSFSASQNRYHNHGVTKGGDNNSGFTGTSSTSWWQRGKEDERTTGTFGNDNTDILNIRNGGTQISGAAFGNGSSGSGWNRIYYTVKPYGSLSLSVNYNGSSKQASKPATIGCMWIVRFE